MSKKVQSMLAFGLAAFTDLVLAEQVHPPLRLQFNPDVIVKLFHSGDQNILNAFADISLEQELGAAENISDTTFSLKVAEGIDFDSYDFDLFINEDGSGKYAVEGKDLRVVGQLTPQGSETPIDFEAPVTKFNVDIEFVPETMEEILVINKDAEAPQLKELLFEVGDVTFASEGTDEATAQLLKEAINTGFLRTYDELWDGSAIERMTQMPVESFLPLIFFRHMAGFSKETTFDNDAFNFGFDPELIFQRARETPKRKKEILRTVESEFSKPEENEKRLMSLILDENILNTFVAEFLLIDKAFSIRELLKSDAKLRPMLSSLTTNSIAFAFPDSDEFKQNKNLDIYASLSHSLIHKHLPDAKQSGFQIDKNGNIRLIFNFTGTMLIQSEPGVKGVWEEARNVWVSLVIKGKVQIKKGKRGSKKFVMNPKSSEIQSIKVTNSQDEEMSSEAVHMTYYFNKELAHLFQFLQPVEIPIPEPFTPKEIECLGISFDELDISIRKGFVEFDVSYKEVDQDRDSAFCQKFISQIRQGPKQAFDTAKEYIGEDPTAYLKDKQDQFQSAMDASKKMQRDFKEEDEEEEEFTDENIQVEL